MYYSEVICKLTFMDFWHCSQYSWAVLIKDAPHNQPILIRGCGIGQLEATLECHLNPSGKWIIRPCLAHVLRTIGS